MLNKHQYYWCCWIIYSLKQLLKAVSKITVVWSQLNFSLHSKKYASQNSELRVFNQHCSLFQIRLWLWPPVITLPATIKPSKQYFSCFDVDWNCIYCWMMIRLNVTNVSKGNRSTSLLLIHHCLSVCFCFYYCWCIPLYLYYILVYVLVQQQQPPGISLKSCH